MHTGTKGTGLAAAQGLRQPALGKEEVNQTEIGKETAHLNVNSPDARGTSHPTAAQCTVVSGARDRCHVTSQGKS